STTSPAKSITTSSPRCTNRCATATLTRRCTGSRGWWRRARIRCTSHGGWCALRPKTSATPIRKRSPWRAREKKRATSLACPEGNTALAQAALYLATAPKSNAIYEAYNHAALDAHKDVAQPVPLHLRNAPTKLMKDLAYGKGYKYAHDEEDAVADMSCLPTAL